MKFTYFIEAFWKPILGFCAGFVFAGLVFTHCNKPIDNKPLPPVTQMVTIKDTVRLFDTITRTSPISVIKWAVKHDTVQLVANIDDTGTIACYHSEQHYKDSAFVSVDMCSKEFPQVKPKDFTLDIKYLPAPQVSHSEISNTITPIAQITLKTDPWYTFKVGAVCVGVGAIGGLIGGIFLMK